MGQGDTHVDRFNDLVEGRRTLEVSVRTGMIHLQLAGGRPVTAETFRLDSEEVEEFITSLRTAKEVVRSKPVGGIGEFVADLVAVCKRHKAVLFPRKDSRRMYVSAEVGEIGENSPTWLDFARISGDGAEKPPQV